MSSDLTTGTDTVIENSTDKKIDSDTSIRKMSENLVEKIDLTKSTSKLIDKIDDSTPTVLNPNPNYLTHFCKNRNWPDISPLKKIFTFSMGKLDEYVGVIIVASLLIPFILWNMLKNYDNIIPFSTGIINIIKLIVIYFIIVFIMKFFFKLLKSLSFWFHLFSEYFKLFLNPLLNHNVSFLYCYFTNYVNWLIYYPAKIFYLICVIGILVVFFMIIIPIIVAISFILSKLLSLLGNNNVNTLIEKMKVTASSIKTTTLNASQMFSKAPGLSSLEKIPGAELIKKIPLK